MWMILPVVLQFARTAPYSYLMAHQTETGAAAILL